MKVIVALVSQQICPHIPLIIPGNDIAEIVRLKAYNVFYKINNILRKVSLL